MYKDYFKTSLKGGTMKAKAIIFSAVLITLTLAFGFNAFSDYINPGPNEDAYGRFLDNYIARCDAKVGMMNSSLKGIISSLSSQRLNLFAALPTKK